MNENMTILVVDDMEINRVILKELFQQDGTILEAENGQQALDILSEHPETDIVIMDIVMPIMNGFEALHAIRQDSRFSGLPVVICTEHAEVDMQVRALDLGSTDFITKPFNARVVRHRIRNLIEVRKMERKIAEQQRVNQLRDILSSVVSPLGLIEFTNDTVRAIYLNQGFFSLFPDPAEDWQVFFSNMLEPMLPEDAEQLVHMFRRNQEDGTPVDIIYRIPQKDGSISIHEMNALSIRYEHFENPVYLASITDITHQRKTELALRDTDQRLKSLINAVPGAILTLDLIPDVKVTYFNDTVCSILNLTRSEFQSISAEDVTSFIYAPDLPAIRQAIHKFIQDPSPFNETFRVRTKDGRLCWIRLSGAPIVTADGTLLCNCVCMDISSEKESELKLEQAFKEMKYRSEHDSLTDIWNRETFNQKTSEFLEAHSDEPYALLAMNIQRFRVINELFGSTVGDEVLRMLSHALCKIVQENGTYGRMEADHFMACLPLSLLDMDAIIQTFDAELKMQYSDYHIEIYFGVYKIQNVLSVDQMCDRATMALKTVKGSAVRRYAIYDDVMRKSLLEEQEIIEEMHDALAQGQFVPYFQPIFSLETLQPVSAEVLVRWMHPVKGLISPGLFVPLFERNGFITALDFHLWDCACEFLHRRQAAGLHITPVSVNISRIDLYHPNLCENLLGLLKKYDLDISLLKLEITESAYIDDPDVLMSVLNRLRECGFQILMDDFGSGYSSLNTLKDMPINIMKVDMCFLRELEGSPRAASILTSVVRMARWLDMPVVAEGVETKAQLDFLRSIDCGMGQGYYFSKPLPMESYEKLLTSAATAEPVSSASTFDTVDLDMVWNSDANVTPLLNSMIGGMAIFSLANGELKVQQANDTYYHVVGRGSQQVFLPAADKLEYFLSKDLPLLVNACLKAQASKQIETITMRCSPDDATGHRLECRVRHLAENDEESTFFIIVNDISSAPSNADITLNQEFKKIFFSESLSVFEIEPHKNKFSLLFQSKEAEEFYPFEKYMEVDSEFIHPDDTDEIEKLRSIEQLQDFYDASRDEYAVQLRIKNKKDNWIWVHLSLYFLTSPTNPAPRLILCVKLIDLSKNAELEWRARAEMDTMSMLYNRGAVQERICRRLQKSAEHCHAFFLMDIDDFKHINDTFGHATGDEAILAVSKVLRKLFRSTDLVGRLGGDEFNAFMSYPLTEDETLVRQKAAQTLEAIQNLTMPGYPELKLSISLGIAIAPGDGTDFEQLYRKADKALYAIKNQGKNNFALFHDLFPSDS